jgi:monoamine oxidase
VPDGVLIIGAGAAGLAAAGVLERAGVRAVILEARERIGGRIHTIHPSSCAVPVELGAEFIHGRPPEIWDRIAVSRLNVDELTGERFYFEDGRIKRINPDEGIQKVLAHMREHAQPDRSFADYLAEVDSATQSEKDWASAYVEGFNAARKEDISLRSLVLTADAAERVGGDTPYRITGGYDGLVASLYSNCGRAELRLGTAVQTLEWKPGAVTAHCAGETFLAQCAIVTLPLGVLQASPGDPGYVRFDPEPEYTLTAARRLRVGQVVRVTFEFRHRFWEWGVPTYRGRLLDLAMLYSQLDGFPTWWTSEPIKAPVITGWASGANADRFLTGSGQQMKDGAVESLARLFGVSPGKVEGEILMSYVHNWHADPFARGAYSYVPVGCMDDVARLAQPVENTLFFAGEATQENGRNGTVDGAIAEGRRAAEEVVRCFMRD